MEQANADIRELLARRRIRFWEVAYALGVCPETFSRWLRRELDAERKKEIVGMIEKLEV